MLYGSLENLVVEWTYQLLIRNPIRPILRCPVCDKIFYRVKKQQYCTRQCFLKAYHVAKSEEAKALKRAADKRSAKKRRLSKAKAR